MALRLFEGLTGLPDGAMRRNVRHAYEHSAKRVIDLLLTLLFLPLWLPAIAIGAGLVMTDGHNPFFRQERIGKGGRRFRIWKLRTMVIDADTQLSAHLMAHPAARAEWDATQKLKSDPRVTRIGRLLRRSSLDELPQFFNVLCGDMSLVGPRPIMAAQAALYSGQCYFKLRPGLTGLWQVSKRNESRFADRVRFDNRYAETLSLTTDLAILARTVTAVLRGTGY